MTFRLQVLFFCFTSCQLSTSNLDCYEDHDSSCYDQPYLGTTQKTNCYGYYSCAHTSTMYTPDVSRCDGAYSCAYITNVTADNGIDCLGIYACANNQHIATSGAFCHGEWSCYNTTFEINCASSSSCTTQCQGGYSCANSIFSHNINATDSSFKIVFDGYKSGINSIFNYVGFGIQEYQFYGLNSGDNTSISCQTGATCNIICDVNACTHLNISCKDGDFNNTCLLKITCNDESSEVSSICPNGVLASGFYDKMNIINDDDDVTSITGVTSGDSICNTSSTSLFSCGNSPDTTNNPNVTAQCLNQSWELGFNSDNDVYNVGICCTALDSCFANSVSINYNIADSIKNIDDDYQVIVRCDGETSCVNNTYNFTGDASFSSSGNNDYRLYFTAFDALQYGEVNGNANLYSNSQINVICSGKAACAYSKFVNISSIYCLGNRACDENSFNNVGTIISAANNALRESSFINIQNIYCMAYVACNGLQIENVNNVEIYGESSFSGQICNVWDGVTAFGKQSLGDTNVTNVTNYAYFYGTQAFGQSVIDNSAFFDYVSTDFEVCGCIWTYCI